MRVKLLKDVRENVTLNALGKISDPGKLKVSTHGGKRYPFERGRVIDMADSSAEKYIEAGLAERTDEPESPGITVEGKPAA